MSSKRGMQLDRVVLLGRTFDEYRGYFLLEPEQLKGKRVLDVAGGVSSFCEEGNAMGIQVTSCDPIYTMTPGEIASRSRPDLDRVVTLVRDLPTYRWTAYRDPEHVRELRERALERFLPDYATHPERYVPGSLPALPFPDREFDVSLVSYFLFVYQEHFSYEFHRDSIRELMRVTKGEVRIYPTVTFEAERSEYRDRLESDLECQAFHFEEVATNFEFLANSNSFLRVTHRADSLRTP
jgi:ubiquinone/menaquinone biosynthesis C-methylase UbiE